MKREAQVSRSPLHDVHVASGARMVEFAGWNMPIQYSGVIEEHLAVRTQVGLFDVSHMGEFSVRGDAALDYLQHLTCNDVAKLETGRVQYTALTTPEGTFVDDLLIYRLGPAEFLLVVNAANTRKDFEWMQQRAGAFDAELADVSGAWAQIAIQGPGSEALLEPLTAAGLGGLRYYSFLQTAVDGVDCLVSRTGYTGEDGFEIYAPAAEGPRLWRAALGSGAAHGALPVGLAARDTLRLEAKMALYGNDIDDTTTVLEADLGWIVKFDKGDFIGREALLGQKERGLGRKLVGFEMRGRGIARHGYRAMRDAEAVGRVTSGTFAPFLKKSIGLAYLPIGLTEVGSEFEVEIRGRREAAVVVPTPFYKRPRKTRR